MGDWISENHLAFARLYKRFYSCVGELDIEPVPADPDPTIPLANLLKKYLEI
jgi:hypothetical protein